MATTGLAVQIGFVWWLKPYVYLLLIVAISMGLEPDWEKLERVMVRGLRWRFAGCRRWQSF